MHTKFQNSSNHSNVVCSHTSSNISWTMVISIDDFLNCVTIKWFNDDQIGCNQYIFSTYGVQLQYLVLILWKSCKWTKTNVSDSMTIWINSTIKLQKVNTSVSLLCLRSSKRNFSKFCIVSGKLVKEFSFRAKVSRLTSIPISGGNCTILFPYRYSSFRWINWREKVNNVATVTIDQM